MRRLTDVAMICAPTWRSRAYAQCFAALDVWPAQVVYLPGREPDWDGAPVVEVDLGQTDGPIRFRPATTAQRTFSEAGVETLTSLATDINQPSVLSLLRDLPQPVVLYSGPGGLILREPTLSIGKRYLHVHGGYAPQYRGSTAFYFSILRQGTIGATALWLDSRIDTGPILLRRSYRVPKGVEVDRVLDPLVRSDVLRQVLIERLRCGDFPAGTPSAGEAAETFHVIHPVLKHLALRRCGLAEQP